MSKITTPEWFLIFLVLFILFSVADDLSAQSKYKTKPIQLSSEPTIVFHDAEPLIGQIGGQYKDDPPNTLFRLVDVPKPYASLILVSDGRVLVQGIDFLVDRQGYVDIQKHPPVRGGSLVAWYRTEKNVDLR